MNDAVDVPEILAVVIEEVGRNSVGAYVVALAVGLGGALLVLLLRGVFARATQRRIERSGRYSRIDRKMAERAVQTCLWLLGLLPLYWAFSLLSFSPPVITLVKFLFLLLYTFGAIRFAGNLLGFFVDALMRRQTGEKVAGTRAVMPIIWAATWAIGATFLLDNLGFQVSSIVAGLGIMGVAVGLAGQAILADFFSYLVILMDRPFQLGDSVRFGAVTGTVVHIGLKTTRLRASTGELVVVPNADMVRQTLGNYRPMASRSQSFTFGVAYETPLEKLRAVPDMVRRAAARIPGLRVNRVHFTTFGDSSLNFEANITVEQPDQLALLDAQQALNLGIMELFAREGIVLAYPTRTVYVVPAAETQAPAVASSIPRSPEF